MEVYDNMIKAMKICAGLDCDPHCPYFGKSDGISKSCRALLLEDAMTTLDDQEAANKTIRAERDGMRIELAKMAEERTTLLNEIHTIRQGKTDRPSVGSDTLEEQIGKLVAHANYQQGRADTLAEIVERCSFGGGGRHE